MPDLSLDLRYLRYVMTVMEQGSFRRAAAKLEIPQSSVSRRVAQLERHLGLSIFDRDHTGVRLTAAGRRFMDEALVGAEHFANAVGAVQGMHRGKGGSIRIGIFTSLRNAFLRSLVGEYHRRHPTVECHFEEGTTQSSVGRVLDGHLDIAFVTGPVVAPGCKELSFGPEQLFVAEKAPSTVTDKTDGPVPLSTFRGRRFIVTRGGRGPNMEDFILSQLVAPGFRPDIRIHDVSFETLLHMVELGLGVAVVSQGAATDDGAISFRPLAGANSNVTTSAIWLASNTNPALKWMVRLARQGKV